jgi:hypothetical protein
LRHPFRALAFGKVAADDGRAGNVAVDIDHRRCRDRNVDKTAIESNADRFTLR